MKSAHKDDKLQPFLESKLKELTANYEYFKNYTQKVIQSFEFLERRNGYQSTG